MTSLFKQTSVKLEPIKAGQKNVPVEWLFDSITKEDIASYVDAKGETQYAIKPGCGCTASFEVLDDRIKALYSDGGNNKGAVSKSVTVYHKPSDPSVPVRSKNERGVDVFNPALGKTVLMFTVPIGS